MRDERTMAVCPLGVAKIKYTKRKTMKSKQRAIVALIKYHQRTPQFPEQTRPNSYSHPNSTRADKMAYTNAVHICGLYYTPSTQQWPESHFPSRKYLAQSSRPCSLRAIQLP